MKTKIYMISTALAILLNEIPCRHHPKRVGQMRQPQRQAPGAAHTCTATGGGGWRWGRMGPKAQGGGQRVARHPYVGGRPGKGPH